MAAEAKKRRSVESCIQAREDEVVVKLMDPQKTEGGIILPTKKIHDTRIGEVVSVGEGYYAGNTRVRITLKPGDMVLIRPNRGTPFTVGSRQYLFLSCHDIPVTFLDPES